MTSAPTFTKSGAKAASTTKLDKQVFEVAVKSHELLKSAYDGYLANGRANLAVTKTRGLVRGGGKKPWKQKGTGRARFGSSRVPIWRGGGITFGPTGNENYSKQLNTKSKRLATKQALSLCAAAGNVIVIEQFDPKLAKTKDLVGLLSKLTLKQNLLIVVDDKTPELVRASQNLSNVKVICASYINTFEVLNADNVIFTSAALKVLTDNFTDSTPKTETK